MHVGLSKTGTTVLQNHFWPWLAEQDENLIYMGKRQVQGTNDFAFKRGFRELRGGFGPYPEMFNRVVDKTLAGIFRHTLKIIRSAGRRFIFSDEIITGFGDSERFDRNLTMLNRAGFEGHYLLFLRDIPDLLESLTPSMLIHDRSTSRSLDYLIDEDGKLDGRTALHVVRRWYRKQGIKARKGKVSLFSTMLDYAGIIRALGPERTSVIRYSGDFSENAAFHAFIRDCYGVEIPADLLARRANTTADSWPGIIADTDRIPWLQDEVKTLLDQVERQIIDRHPDCQASRRLFARLDPDRPALGSELLPG